MWLGMLLLESALGSAVRPPLPAPEGPERGALAELAGSGRYDVYRLLGEGLGSPELIIDAAVRQPGWVGASLDPVLVLGLSDVVRVDRSSSPPQPPDDRPDRSGRYWGGEWDLWRVDEQPTTVIAMVVDDWRLGLVDARLAPEVVPSPGRGLSAAPIRPVLSPPVAEWSVVVLLLLVGGLLVPRRSPTPLRLALALLVGTSIGAVSGLLLQPGVRSLLIAVAAVVATQIVLRRRGVAVGWSAADARPLLVAGVMVAVTVGLTRRNGWVVSNPDSVDYLAGARALARGALGVEILQPKRGVAQQALHAPVFALSDDWIRALGVLALLATAVLLVMVLRGIGTSRSTGAVAILFGAILIASPAVRTLAMFVNAHVLVAGLVLALVLLLGLADPSPQAERLAMGGGPAAAVVAAALVLLRPEGIGLVGLLLLGTLVDPARRAAAGAAWIGAGIATVTWHGLLLSGALRRGDGPSILLVAMMVAGIVATAVPGIVRWLPGAHWDRLPRHALAGLWVGAVALSLLPDRGRFLVAVQQNLFEGAGGWGLMLPVLAVALLWAAGRRSMVGAPLIEDPVWIALVGIVPLLVIAKALDGAGDEVFAAGRDILGGLARGGGSVGWRDSVNRGWIHVVPLALVAIAREVSPALASGRRSRGVAAALGCIAAAWLWQPTYLVPEQRIVLLADAPTGAGTVGAFVTGSRVSQTVSIPPDALVEAGLVRDPEVCVTLVFGTYGREVSGQLDVVFRNRETIVRTFLDPASFADNVPIEICMPVLAPLTPSPVVEVGVLQLPPDEPITLWVGEVAAGPGGSSLLLTPGSPSSSVGPIVDALTVRGATDPPLRRALRSSVRLFPTIVGLMLAGSLLASARRGSTTRAGVAARGRVAAGPSRDPRA